MKNIKALYLGMAMAAAAATLTSCQADMDAPALVVRAEGATEWTDLEIPTWPGTTSWAFVNSGEIDLSAYVGKKVQIGFKYESSDAGADTWEIKNVKVTGTK